MRPTLTKPGAFTLVELLVTLAIIGILASLILPALARAKEKAKVAKVHAELYGVGLALEMYADDHEGRLPPVRVDCNTDIADHWCQFPVELAELHYLPRGSRPGMAANMEDVFNPGHTYKYAAPGPQLLNDSPGGNFKVWAPDDFPISASPIGKWWSTPKDAPVRWVVWSLGPHPDSDKSQDSHAPLTSAAWYRRTGDRYLQSQNQTRPMESNHCTLRLNPHRKHMKRTSQLAAAAEALPRWMRACAPSPSPAPPAMCAIAIDRTPGKRPGLRFVDAWRRQVGLVESPA